MQFVPIRCPECNQLAKGTIDTVPGVALFATDPATGETEVDAYTGEVDYFGETKMNWDGQETMTDENGNPLLCCPNGHHWATRIKEDGNQLTLQARAKPAEDKLLLNALEAALEILDNSDVRHFVGTKLGEQAKLHRAINLGRHALKAVKP
jgi:hypothetical protein